MKAIKAFDRLFAYFEEGFVIVSLGTMVLIAFIQVILRNIFSTGISWADELTRHLVLWIGFVAGSLATREGRHISIDILSRILPPNLKRWNEIVVSIGALIVCALLFKASLHFVSVERAYGEMSGSLRVPIWLLECIFPIVFGILTLRFGIKVLEAIFPKKT